jgi:hypothetical protein
VDAEKSGSGTKVAIALTPRIQDRIPAALTHRVRQFGGAGRGRIEQRLRQIFKRNRTVKAV